MLQSSRRLSVNQSTIRNGIAPSMLPGCFFSPFFSGPIVSAWCSGICNFHNSGSVTLLTVFLGSYDILAAAPLPQNPIPTDFRASSHPIGLRIDWSQALYARCIRSGLDDIQSRFPCNREPSSLDDSLPWLSRCACSYMRASHDFQRIPRSSHSAESGALNSFSSGSRIFVFHIPRYMLSSVPDPLRVRPVGAVITHVSSGSSRTIAGLCATSHGAALTRVASANTAGGVVPGTSAATANRTPCFTANRSA